MPTYTVTASVPGKYGKPKRIKHKVRAPNERQAKDKVLARYTRSEKQARISR